MNNPPSHFLFAARTIARLCSKQEQDETTEEDGKVIATEDTDGIETETGITGEITWLWWVIGILIVLVILGFVFLRKK